MSANDHIHLSRTTSKTTRAQSLEGSVDFDLYQPPTTSPRVVRARDAKLSDTSSPQAVLEMMPNANQQEASTQESGREKLLRHWTEVAGSVCIPEKWDQETSLKDWMDCSLFDAFLAPNGAVSAREALIAERKRESERQYLMQMEPRGKNSSEGTKRMKFSVGI
ncbi:hypothetical protein ACH5RR_021131 [Cinchona calisaya]|uniref:Uncharacterized protein n=1 Tax=Cinchona calisaya TaxID=153742 RepID=A0ABD2ZJD1_9GENT